MVNVALLLDFFYIVVVAWSLWYLAASLNPTLEWSRCDHDFNTDSCYDPATARRCRNLGQEVFRRQCRTMEEICSEFNLTPRSSAAAGFHGWSALRGSGCYNGTTAVEVDTLTAVGRTTSVEEYWENYVLAHPGYDWSNFVSTSS